MINYVGQELKGLKDESFKEHTLIHLFWADSGQGTFQFLKEAYCGKLFFSISILSIIEFRKNTVCMQRGP